MTEMRRKAAAKRAKVDRITRMLQRAHALHVAGDLGNALVIYQELLTEQPTNPRALHYAAIIGRQLNEIARQKGRPTADDEVMSLMAQSIAANPNNAAGLHNFAKFKQERGELADARHLYEHAVALDPTQIESWANLGNVYAALGNRMRADAAWDRAVTGGSMSDDSIYNVSFIKIMRGDWARGWREFEHRWNCPDFFYAYGRPDLKTPIWTGKRVDTLYLHQEQGIGDALMMARFIDVCRLRARTVVVEVYQPLVSLFRWMFPDLQIVQLGEDPPAHDAHLSLFSLPALFGTTLADLIRPGPFPAFPDQTGPEPGRIGLCWRGSTTHINDRMRSMPFEALFPLLDLAGVHNRFTWQSLQYGFDVFDPIDPCPTGDFLETARAIARCSLVITVDTSVAHLAGVMGVPTWILLPHAAEWRWLIDRDDCVWYPSARLWRQRAPGDWKGLVNVVATQLLADRLAETFHPELLINA